MSLRVHVLGGLGEVGMNCMALEYDDEIVMIDCGLLFTDLEHFGVDFAIPNFSRLLEQKDKIKAILITHAHEDHIGAIPFAYRAGIRAPIYCSAFAERLIAKRLSEFCLEDKCERRIFSPGEPLQLKHFKIEAVPVNHSIVEATALFIDSPLGKIIHTGDFKIDPSPYYGRMMDLGVYEKAGSEGVLLLMSDSTNIEVREPSLSEKNIYHKFEEVFAAAEGLVVVSTFASNVARMGQVFELAAKMQKKVAVTGRSMLSNLESALDCNYLEHAKTTLISVDDIDRYARKDVVLLSTGSQGEFGSALDRIASGEHRMVEVQAGDTVILSSKFIPGNEIAISRVINQLFRQGADVLYDAIHDVHVSGHATHPELKRMLEIVRPRFFIPVHGEYRHLVHHAQLARECGIPAERAPVIANGQVVELNEDRIDVVDQSDEIHILVEGVSTSELQREVLKERRKLAERGAVFALLTRDSMSGQVLAGPQILTKGVTDQAHEGWIIEEGAKIVSKTVEREQSRSEFVVPCDLLQEEIRIELRRFFKSNLGIKPSVIAIVMDLG